MLASSPFMGDGYGYPGYLSVVPRIKDRAFHKRASSGSSVASAGPPSPLSQTNITPRIATSDATYSPSYDYDFTQTPQTATSSKTMPLPSAMFQSGYDEMDMRRIHSAGADERTYAGPQSVSSMSHNSPATPQTNYENEFEDTKFLVGKTFDDNTMFQYLQGLGGYPSSNAYHESLQDVFPNQSFQPMANFSQQMPHRTNVGSAQNMMRNRLQAAQQDHLRTASPSVSVRESSPFKQNSDFAMPAPQRPRQMPTLQKQRTSVSPKELMLDEHDVDEPTYPLFPDTSSFNHRRNKSNLSTSYTPSFSQESNSSLPPQYQFLGNQRQDTAGLSDTPDFPAHMLSMESTNEEGPSMPSSQDSIAKASVKNESEPEPTSAPSKPVDTSSDSGTYSCTYHGCSMRFDTPTKLQKHKREGHRQQSPSSSTRAAALSSQAGPHRCERINPSTGKPCNSVFSRPYDLTRHEDTIHNARKQKVRCHLCTEEKTFSRNDALTRHMRVVHPDVDWVGKQRSRKQK